MEPKNTIRDFTSISPSAKWMLLWKGYTNIPFARKVAELLEYPNKYTPDYKKRDYTFWASTMALEKRYWSIDKLLNDLDIKNILEISSGYSLRSLAYAQKNEVHYIDTDLPEVIATKKELIYCIDKDELDTNAKLEVLPLNVLDKSDFQAIVGHFSQGPVVIVNEGLLQYLNREEKEKLCSIIHDILMERGGYWITADIQTKNKESKLDLKFSDEIKDFNNQQNIETNTFETFLEMELFFKEMGFLIDKEADIKYSEMSSFKYFVKSMTLRHLLRIRKAGQIQATWRLKAV
jgi:O-methyltransferase involved in polyketide biosynthesis